MARTFSPSMVQAVTRVEGERPVILVSITHVDLVTPIRIADVDNVVTSRGNDFIGLPFRIVLPSAERDTPPRARLAVDNVGRELMQWLEVSRGGAGARVLLELVMFDTPDIVEWSSDLRLSNLTANQIEVSGDLGHDDLVNALLVAHRFDTVRAPGLF